MEAHRTESGLELRPREPLAVQFTGSLHYSGNVIADDFQTIDGLSGWIAANGWRLGAAQEMPVAIGSAELARVVRVREAVRALFDAAVNLRVPGSAVVSLVDEEARRVRAAALRWSSSGPSFSWPPLTSATEILTAQACASAVRLLTSGRREALRRCPAPRCVLFFCALRPGQVWCSQACGNRARVARHSARTAG